MRTARPEDAGALARIYGLALPGDVAARFGNRYLTTHFFPELIASPHGRIVVAEGPKGIEGFCILATDPAAMNSAVKSRPVAAALAIAMASLRDPLIVRDIWSSLFRVRTEFDRLPGRNYAEIYLMAIDPQAQGKGLGRVLIETVLRNLPHGCIAKTSSEAAAAFYSRAGFATIGREWRGKRTFQILFRGA